MVDILRTLKDAERSEAEVSVEQLVEFITKNDFGNKLDDSVHDILSERASRINNEGPEAQVTFLLENGIDLKEIIYIVTGEKNMKRRVITTEGA